MNLSVITVNSADDSYKIKRLLWKWVNCWGCEFFTEYFVQWKGYRSEFNVWYNLKNLGDTKELIKKYNEHMTREQETDLL